MWRTKKFEQSVVVLGAGFAGLECAKQLSKKLRNRAQVHVALVDRENYSVFQPLLPEVASANIASEHVVNPVRMMARHVDFDCSDVERIELDEQMIYFTAPEGMEMMPMPYTHLIIALGMVPNMDIIPGMAAHGLAMKTVGDAYHLRNHVITQLEQAANTADSELRKELLTIVTIGAGFSGVETCAEVHDMMHAALKYYPELEGETIRSVLISSTDRILPAMSVKLSAYSLRALRKRGIEIRLQARATSVTPNACFVDDGSEIPTRTVISTVGNRPHPVLVEADLPKHRGRLETDEYMRVKGHDNIWAIGDCAWIINAHDGQPSPPTAQFAMRQGKQCAHNVVRALDGQKLEPFSFKQLGYLASLGHMSAVCEMFGFIRLGGFLGWWVWRTIYLSKLPTWYRRIRVVIDWTIALLFPRDICQLETRASSRVSRRHYEPGQEIIRQGDRGDTFFTIVSGEVEVSKDEPAGGSNVLAHLGPGSYFGEEALLSGTPRSATVVAKTKVDVLSLGRSDFQALAGNLKSLGDEFKKIRGPAFGKNSTRSERAAAALKKLRVADHLSGEPVSVPASASAERICRAFHDEQCHGVAVLDAGGSCIGILDRYDLHRAYSGDGNPVPLTAGDLAGSSRSPTVGPGDDLYMAIELFDRHHVEQMCVVDASNPPKLVGILSITDVLQAYIEIEAVLQNPELAQGFSLPENLLEAHEPHDTRPRELQ